MKTTAKTETVKYEHRLTEEVTVGEEKIALRAGLVLKTTKEAAKYETYTMLVPYAYKMDYVVKIAPEKVAVYKITRTVTVTEEKV